jgi:hypothetical protein
MSDHLRVYIIPDGRFWFAQGIEVDYGVQGDSVDEAKRYFEDGLERTVELNLERLGNVDGLSALESQRFMDELGDLARFRLLSSTPKVDWALPFSAIDYYVLP